jgi:uncharacterized membrane protein SpoIIM required for sporulation
MTGLDVDAFVRAHSGEWSRLDELSRRRTLTGPDSDELVELYQRTATHLSMVQSSSPDPALVSRLSSLVARARSAVTGAHTPAWAEAARFVRVVFPVAVWRARWWVIASALGFVAVALAVGWWVATHPDVQATLGTPQEIRDLVDSGFADYYSSNPAGSFAARVWTNNAWAAAQALVFGACLVVPCIVYALWPNALNVGIVGGIMAANGKLDLFFGLIVPHGLLELTAVFVAAGVGMRLGWTIIDPGARPRSVAVAQEGRAAFSVAIGLVVVLAVSGAIEAFVTPSPLPTWARIGIGLLAWGAFLAYVIVFGRRAERVGDIGDLVGDEAVDVLPYAA